MFNHTQLANTYIANAQIAKTANEAGREAAKLGASLLRDALEHQQEANIILATGASQFDMLDQLLKEPDIDWHRVQGFHLDEYLGLPITHNASFRKYLWERFICRLPVPLKAFHYIDGASDPTVELQRINTIISTYPIDIAFIGIGENGHIAFNDPPADFDTTDPYIVVELDEACRRQQWNEGWFPTLKSVPRQAISMSVRHIMKSKVVICTVPDERKANAVQRTFSEKITPEIPASILQQHPACYFFLDAQSASLLHQKDSNL